MSSPTPSPAGPPRSSLSLVRLLALGWALLALVQLAGNVLQTWDTFNPSYWSYYVQQQLARPLLALGAAGVLLLLARPCSRWLDRP